MSPIKKRMRKDLELTRAGETNINASNAVVVSVDVTGAVGAVDDDDDDDDIVVGSVSLSKMHATMNNLLQQLEKTKKKNIKAVTVTATVSAKTSDATGNDMEIMKTDDNDKKNDNDKLLLLSTLANGLLQIKTWQRDLLSHVHASQLALVQSKLQQDELELQLASLHYERMHLQHEIAECHSFSMPHLFKLATEETIATASSSSGGGEYHKQQSQHHQQQQQQQQQKDDKNEQEDNVNNDNRISIFLQADEKNPTHRQRIVTKLHQELNARGGLERDLKSRQQQLSELQLQLQKKMDFLSTLPDRLNVMERASQPLQKFMRNATSHNSTSNNSNPMAASTERRNRLELAQALPGPLYTLFVSLQQYADYQEQPHSFAAADPSSTQQQHQQGISISVSGDEGGGDHNNKQVLLHIPVPDVTQPGLAAAAATTSPSSSTTTSSSARPNKRVVIHFHFAPVLGLVTAVASGCGSTLNQDLLLEELFPNDTTLVMMPENKASIVSTSSSTTTTATTTTSTGKPYQWCNHLAGIYPVVEQQQQQQSSSLLTTTATVLDTQQHQEQQHQQQQLQLQQQRWSSTRIIVRELRRRVRANATLKYLLNHLQQGGRGVPDLPGQTDTTTTTTTDTVGSSSSSSSNSRLVSFKPMTNNNDTSDSNDNSKVVVQDYMVHLRRGGGEGNGSKSEAPGNNLKIKVRVHKARYPGIPPVWTLNPNNSNNNNNNSDYTQSPPLYNDRLALLERQVNVDTLKPPPPAAAAADTNDVYYEWILIRQLKLIMQQWDQWCNDDDGTAGNNLAGGGGTSAAAGNKSRTVRGRDRLPIQETK